MQTEIDWLVNQMDNDMKEKVIMRCRELVAAKLNRVSPICDCDRDCPETEYFH